MKWGSIVERERRRRIRLTVAAYAYEKENVSLMTDDAFDKMALEVDPHLDTGNALLDKFFREEFSPHTGQWIHRHPELDKVAKWFTYIYNN